MRFAVPLPWWGYLLAFAAALFVAWISYARFPLSLTRPQRTLLMALRAVTLVLLVAFLLRPVIFVQAQGISDSLVPILIDVSRSMRIADAGNSADAASSTRIERAAAIVRQLQQQFGASFKTELVTFGETVAKGDLNQLTADARRSDLSGALAAVADRYRGQRLAAIVVVSDGGDTAPEEAGRSRRLDAPIFPIGVGNPQIARDREVLNVTAGEPLLSDSSIDLSVAAVSHGYGKAPIEIRVSENGRPIDLRRVTPSADGAPVHEVFTVSPSPQTPTVYTVEIPTDGGELAAENNVRRVLVPPQGRKRRVLVVEGAPGFEHTFMKRALQRDMGLEVDSVIRKGRNEEGRDTFIVQAGAGRSAALAEGYPVKRADLFRYDAIVFGNIGGDFFTRDQLSMTADFVSERGGGLLVLGARSFDRAGLVGTPLEEVLPVDSTDRRWTATRSSVSSPPSLNMLTLTTDGTTHPATRLALTVAESGKRWAQLPAMASAATLGAPRPGAQVLAVTATAGGELRPVIVTQRYGLGRSMVFGGEASWRWRMMLPASDNTFELAWRQMARWLTVGAAEPTEMPPTSVTLPATTQSLSVMVRNEEFKPIGDAEVMLRVREPGGQERSLSAALSDPQTGRYSAAVRFEQAGVYSVSADVRRGSQSLGSATRPILVGGADLEMAEPRLNEPVLRRIAETTGGKYLSANDVAEVPSLVRAADTQRPPTEMRDLWDNGWTLAMIVALLAGEWIARRRFGLA
jgi:uncharacterized membrane protein